MQRDISFIKKLSEKSPAESNLVIQAETRKSWRKQVDKNAPLQKIWYEPNGDVMVILRKFVRLR